MYIQKYYKVIRVIKDGDGGATPLYIENVSDSDGLFKLDKNGSPTTPNLIYRIGDNGEWFEYDMTTLPSITVPSGSKIYFRGDNINGFNQNPNGRYEITFSKSYNIGGYITSLLALDNFNTITDIPNYSFNMLFYNESNLLNAKDLITSNITTVGDYGFSNFFNICTTLTTPPTFENVTTVGYKGFYNCFQRCTALTITPNFNNVTTIGSSGFEGCFYGCTTLTTPPTFENVTTVGYNGFYDCFDSCTALTITPNFNNVTTIGSSGFNYCFYGCTSLQVVYAPSISTWNTGIFNQWLYNVSPTGVMYKPTGLEIPTGTSGVPEGWATVDY